MSGVKLFVDTNILLYFLKGNREVTELIADNDLSISFITELELLSFPQLKNRDKTQINGLLDNCTIIDIKPEIKKVDY